MADKSLPRLKSSHSNHLQSASSSFSFVSPVAITNYAATPTNGIPPMPSPSAVPAEAFNGLTFMTLDRFVTSVRPIYTAISGANRLLNWDSNNDLCVENIRSLPASERVFLISSGSQGRIVVPQIHALPQVHAIYIHCANVEPNQQWASEYSKVRVVCSDAKKSLIPQFAADVAQALLEWGTALLDGEGKPADAKRGFEKALDILKRYAKSQECLELLRNIEDQLKRCA